MNPNWLGVVSAVLAFMAFGLVYHRAKGYGLKRLISPFFVAVILAIPGASFAIHYAHIFPESGWYYQFRSLPGTEFLIVFLGVAGGLLAAMLPRVILILPLLGVAAFSIAPIVKPFIGPIASETFMEDWDGEVCLQSTPSTCGAASTATILKFLGGAATESELAAEAHSYIGGTEAWYLARAVKSRGFDVTFDLESSFSPEGGLPAVVGVRLGTIGHFIAVLEEEGGKWIIGDPLKGREIFSREELLRRYEFTGFHMRISKLNN